MPFFRVRQMTSSQLRNFIALEQCQSQLENYFTTYAIFMCNIIKTESDVSTLRKYGIIETMLGNDKEVAKMFNSLLKGTLLTYKKDYINSSLFKDVKNYFDIPHHRWRAKVVSASFRSPWAPISVIAAVISFLISITQLAFTILRRSAN
ncbi:hypothetical protein Taro_016647 [Colocasia esculenta]|uniref:Uncharacterized protein n=1 Tax=Colocasia esculenta TaxID=4460 RepID=A0A843UEB7_COLES|nr:hypothetical protein [Colocasia esculenta]